VFFRAEQGEAAAANGISGTHMLLWLPHFHDFCLTVFFPLSCPLPLHAASALLRATTLGQHARASNSMHCLPRSCAMLCKNLHEHAPAPCLIQRAP
jgi:hypothetical protein